MSEIVPTSKRALILKAISSGMTSTQEVAALVGFPRKFVTSEISRLKERGLIAPDAMIDARLNPMKCAQCEVKGCCGSVHAKGLCSTHYHRARDGAPIDGNVVRRMTPEIAEQIRAARPTHSLRQLAEMVGFSKVSVARVISGWEGGGPMGSKMCHVPNCGGKFHAVGLCKLHYDRQRDRLNPAPRKSPMRRAESTVEAIRLAATCYPDPGIATLLDCGVKTVWEIRLENKIKPFGRKPVQCAPVKAPAWVPEKLVDGFQRQFALHDEFEAASWARKMKKALGL